MRCWLKNNFLKVISSVEKRPCTRYKSSTLKIVLTFWWWTYVAVSMGAVDGEVVSQRNCQVGRMLKCFKDGEGTGFQTKVAFRKPFPLQKCNLGCWINLFPLATILMPKWLPSKRQAAHHSRKPTHPSTFHLPCLQKTPTLAQVHKIHTKLPTQLWETLSSPTGRSLMADRILYLILYCLTFLLQWITFIIYNF